jgi:chromosome partitioning protein
MTSSALSRLFYSLWYCVRSTAKVPLVYVPNRVKANVKYETRMDVDEQLAKLGSVTSALPDRVDFQRVSTFQTPLAILPMVLSAFDMIYKQFLHE